MHKSGCDTVSYPYLCEKKRAMKVALELRPSMLSLAEYGFDSGSFITDNKMKSTTSCQFLVALYGMHTLSGILRTSSSSDICCKESSIRHLPQTEDAFQLHVSNTFLHHKERDHKKFLPYQILLSLAGLLSMAIWLPKNLSCPPKPQALQ